MTTDFPARPNIPARPEPRRVTTFTLMTDRRNWPMWLVVVACACVFVAQKLSPDLLSVGFFSSQAVHDGRWWTIVTSIFMHGNSVHILSNMWAYLVLSPFVIARFGQGWRGVAPYHIFYLSCGLAGNFVFWALHPNGDNPVVGASGAIYGVYAAGMRLDLFDDKLTPIWSRRTLDAIWFFIWSNLLVIALFGGPDLVLQILRGQGGDLAIPIAWEAHLGGFIAGFFLIQLMAGKGWKDHWKAGIVVMPAYRPVPPQDFKA